jgi:hypothetical protein
MPLWTRSSAPKWVPDAVRTSHGWEHPKTGEVLVIFGDTSFKLPEAAATIAFAKFNKKKYKSGDVIKFTLEYNEPVIVTGAPRVPITIGTKKTYLNYISTNDADAAAVAKMLFEYTVVAGDSATASQVTLGQAAVAASVNILAGNAGITYTAVTAGTGGNAITVRYVVSGNNTALSVAVVSSAITVNLATDGGGAATSTATLVKAAVDASGPASALVATALIGDGTGVVSAVTATNLAGGLAAISATAIDLNSGTITDQGSAPRATHAFGSSNAEITFTAVTGGTSGNSLHVALVNPGTNNHALTVGVSSGTLTVTLATNGSAAATSTVAQVIAAVNGDATASQTFIASTTGNGTGTVVAVGSTALSGGADSVSSSTSFSSVAPDTSAITVN